jgi:hypothetical protein
VRGLNEQYRLILPEDAFVAYTPLTVNLAVSAHDRALPRVIML